MTKEDIECIIRWFSHIEQLATDGKTANGFEMTVDKLLATIRVVAKDSREYVEKFCNESTPNNLETAAEESANKKWPLHPFGIEAKVDENGTIVNYDEWLDDFRLGIQSFSANGGYKDGFIAGAKWQKEQMLKEGIEGEVQVVTTKAGWRHSFQVYAPYDGDIRTGQKVIIIKDEE